MVGWLKWVRSKWTLSIDRQRPIFITSCGRNNAVVIPSETAWKTRGWRRYFVALIENVCGNESLCSGKRHHPSAPFSMTGKAW